MAACAGESRCLRVLNPSHFRISHKGVPPLISGLLCGLCVLLAPGAGCAAASCAWLSRSRRITLRLWIEHQWKQIWSSVDLGGGGCAGKLIYINKHPH